MDDKVNDFLNEINEIAPPPTTKPEEDEVWKQCFDELTGYAYYWNKKTDEVTWTRPNDLKSSEVSSKKPQYIPKHQPSFPSVTTTSKLVPKEIKIHSIGANSRLTRPKVQKESKVNKKCGKDSDSEDEKITLISSYGTDTESEEESPSNASKDKQSPAKNSDEDNDSDILTKIIKRAQELKELGGDLPPEVKIVVKSSKPQLIKSDPGVSLVAGYSDSEEETEEIKPNPELPQVSHSTLFPIPQPINIDDFTLPKKVEEENNLTETNDNFDNKAFQRKRKIGVTLVNTVKRTNIENDEEKRQGLGFNSSNSSINVPTKPDSIFPGGIAFVKSDILNPNTEINSDKDSIKLEEINNTYSTLKEKLLFLNEGRPDMSPVQSMIIQAETLFLARNAGALKLSYFQTWLKDTYSELVKLEKEATPAGWILQWDKSHKRYFYQNMTTGESQWEYPQPDISTCDDAMDISTTPPHVTESENIDLSPPLPPPLRSPTPPPPPIISSIEEETNLADVPLPKTENSQPLPPGVDGTEIPSFESFVDTKDKQEIADPLNSALDSFYSDIAAITASPPSLPPSTEESIPDNSNTEIKIDPIKKKKKTKVKLAPGLSMKKKGVSKLVEKWKNLQQEYN